MSNFIVKRGETIPLETRSLISTRYKSITKAINREFRNIILLSFNQEKPLAILVQVDDLPSSAMLYT